MKTERHKAWLVVLAVFSSLLLLLLLALPKLLNLNRYRDSVQSLAEEALGVQLLLGSIRWGVNLNNSVWFEAETLALKDSSLPAASLVCGKVTVKIAVSPLLQKRVVIKDILLRDAVLKIEPTEEARQARGRAQKTSTTTPSAYSFELESLRVEDGQLIVSDQRGDARVPELHLNDITAGFSQSAPGAALDFDLALRQASPGLESWGHLSAHGSLLGITPAFGLEKPELDVSARIDDFAAEALRPWLNRELASQLSGSLSSTLHYRGWPGGKGKTNGQIDLGQFNYRDPELWQHPLPGSPATLDFTATIQDDRIEFDRLAFALKDIKADGRLTIGNLKQQAVISGGSLNAEIPLETAGSWVPWSKLEAIQPQLQDLLAGGGTVRLVDIQLPDFDLAGQGFDQINFFNAITGSIQLSKLSSRPVAALPRFEIINGHLLLANGSLTGKDIKANVGPLNLPPISVQARQLLDSPQWAVRASGPMSLTGKSSTEIQSLLATHNLAELSTDAVVDLELDYDASKPGEWQANGRVRLDDLQLTTLRNKNHLSMRGQVEVEHDRGLKLQLNGIRGTLNQSPISADGTVHRDGKGALLLDLEVKTSNLDLAQLAEVAPSLQATAMKGSLDADMAVFYDSSQTHKTRLNGVIDGNNLELQAGGFTLEKGRTQLRLAGKQVGIEKMSLQLNQQPIAVSGTLNFDQRLRGGLIMASPELNLDSLLATRSRNTPAASSDVASSAGQGAVKLPALLRDASLEIKADIARGVYRGLDFHGMRLVADYDREVVRDHELLSSIAGGTIKTSGRIGLQDLSQVKFDADYELANIRLEVLVPVIIENATTLSGPLSSTGQIAGTSGSGLLPSLRGHIYVNAGPGRMAEVGPLTKTMFHVLKAINLDGIIQGSIGEDFDQKGISFEALAVEMELDQQGAHVKHSNLLTAAFDAAGEGVVDLASNTLDMEVELTVLGTLDKVAGLAPVFGSVASNITKVYLVVKGPLGEPTVMVRPAQGVIKTMKGGIKDPLKEFGRGLDSLLDLIDDKGKKRR